MIVQHVVEQFFIFNKINGFQPIVLLVILVQQYFNDVFLTVGIN